MSNGPLTFQHLLYLPDVGVWGPDEVELLRRDQELYPRAPEWLPPWHPAR